MGTGIGLSIVSTILAAHHMEYGVDCANGQTIFWFEFPGSGSLLEKKPVQFHCDCSRERVERAIVSIGKKEIREMIEEGKPIEAGCQFCNKKYSFSVEELEELLQKAVRP